MYYLPEIVSNNKFCDHWGFVIGQLEMASVIPIDIEELVERANEFYPINGRKYVDDISK